MSLSLSKTLNKFGKFSGTLRQVQFLVSGTAYQTPDGNAIKQAFINEGWSIKDFKARAPLSNAAWTVIIPISLLAGVTYEFLITANVDTQYSVEAVAQNAKSLMSAFLYSPQVAIIQTKAIASYDNSILDSLAGQGASDSLLTGLGISLPIAFLLGIAGLLLYKKL